MNAKENVKQKQKDPDGPQRYIKLAWIYMKNIGGTYIKPYLRLEEQISDIGSQPMIIIPYLL